MNLKAVSRRVAEAQNRPLSEVEPIVKATFAVIEEALATGDETVNIPNFGTFVTRDRAATKTRHILTGAPLDVSARRVARFRPSVRLREKVRNSTPTG